MRFMKRPEDAGIRVVVWNVETFRVLTLRVVAVLAVMPEAAWNLVPS
jgi:hypothetical protein